MAEASNVSQLQMTSAMSFDIAVDFGISGQYVTRLLDHVAIFRGYPVAVRTDNGTEFTNRGFLAWTVFATF
jgi:putative transposase